MKIRILILSLIIVFGNMGCIVTIPILTALGTGGAIISKYIDHKLERESLELRRGELELKRDKFEYEKEIIP